VDLIIIRLMTERKDHL